MAALSLPIYLTYVPISVKFCLNVDAQIFVFWRKSICENKSCTFTPFHYRLFCRSNVLLRRSGMCVLDRLAPEWCFWRYTNIFSQHRPPAPISDVIAPAVDIVSRCDTQDWWFYCWPSSSALLSLPSIDLPFVRTSEAHPGRYHHERCGTWWPTGGYHGRAHDETTDGGSWIQILIDEGRECSPCCSIYGHSLSSYSYPPSKYFLFR